MECLVVVTLVCVAVVIFYVIGDPVMRAVPCLLNMSSRCSKKLFGRKNVPPDKSDSMFPIP